MAMSRPAPVPQPIRPSMLALVAIAWLLGCGAAQAATVNVACVGDSITEGFGTSDKRTTAYPAVLQKLLGDGYTVGNFGHGGATAMLWGDNIYSESKEYRAADASAPDIVVIELGGNDSKFHPWSHKERFPADYAALIAHYQGLPSHPRVFVTTCCKVYGEGCYGVTDPVVRDGVNPLIRAAAAAAKVPVIDIYTAMSGIPEHFPDRVHPDDAGYAILAKAVAAALAAAPR